MAQMPFIQERELSFAAKFAWCFSISSGSFASTVGQGELARFVSLSRYSHPRTSACRSFLNLFRSKYQQSAYLYTCLSNLFLIEGIVISFFCHRDAQEVHT